MKEKSVDPLNGRKPSPARGKTSLMQDPKKYGMISHIGNERSDLIISGSGKRWLKRKPRIT